MDDLAQQGGGLGFWDVAPGFILMIVIVAVLFMLVRNLLK